MIFTKNQDKEYWLQARVYDALSYKQAECIWEWFENKVLPEEGHKNSPLQNKNTNLPGWCSDIQYILDNYIIADLNNIEALKTITQDINATPLLLMLQKVEKTHHWGNSFKQWLNSDHSEEFVAFYNDNCVIFKN